jgi:hypothetical protein
VSVLYPDPTKLPPDGAGGLEVSAAGFKLGCQTLPPHPPLWPRHDDGVVAAPDGAGPDRTQVKIEDEEEG